MPEKIIFTPGQKVRVKYKRRYCEASVVGLSANGWKLLVRLPDQKLEEFTIPNVYIL